MTVYDELLREAIDSVLFALESAVKSVRQLKAILEDTV